jgi:hypothetical protein
MCHFQRMVKSSESLKDLVDHASEAVSELLGEVPMLREHRIKPLNDLDDRTKHADIMLKALGHTLICEVKESGQPRHVRSALLQLKSHVAHLGKNAVPIFIAPFLSPESQALCIEAGAGFLDLEGNARIAFGPVFIERRVASKPSVERRELKSLFSPKAACVLRVLLRDPKRSWRVVDLAEAAVVSLGQVSNVRTALRNKEWADVSSEGLMLTKPGALLDAWRQAHASHEVEQLRFYTALHGQSFDKSASLALGTDPKAGRAILASFSAAKWLAPFGRINTNFFYADESGLRRLRDVLRLSTAEKGENVVIMMPKDHGVFRDTEEPAPNMVCTSAVQTYLDLSVVGERGMEAAEHLRRERLSWPR